MSRKAIASCDFAQHIVTLVRASGPVTLADIIRELQTQSLSWDTLHPFERDCELSAALSSLAKDGVLTIDASATGNELAFDISA